MRKNLCLLIFGLFLFFIESKAQYQRPLGSELSIGVEGALPLNGWTLGDGNNAKVSSFGIGGSLKYAYNFNESVAATLQSGYIYFPGKNFTDEVEGINASGKINTSQIPVKAGIRYSFGQFYFEPQLGVSFLHANVSASGSDNQGNMGSAKESENTSAFTFAANIGVMVSPNFDISLSYEDWSKDGSTGFLGLRLAYTFPLK